MSLPVSQAQSSFLISGLQKALLFILKPVLPPYLYGPFSPERLPLPKPEFDALSTNLMLYNLLFPTGVYPSAPGYVDIRDTAKAHIGALDSKPDKNRKRFVFGSPHGLGFQKVLDIIKKEHPELERRFITKPIPEFPYDRFDVDFERIEEITGMRKQDFQTFEAVCSMLPYVLMRTFAYFPFCRPSQTP